MTAYHVPALLNESIDALAIDPNGIYVDATFGSGGHSYAILEKLTKGKLIAFDQDADALTNLREHPNLLFVQHNFKYIRQFLHFLDIKHIDGILADLGVSSHHFDEAERGFSIRFDGPLDMRMNKNASITAATVLNEYPTSLLHPIFKQYGEVENTGKLVKLIDERRKAKPFDTIADFIEAIQSLIPKRLENKYLAKVFQALRMEVNQELPALKDLLMHSVDLLRPGGRLAIITYHSLEDRLVKNFIRSGNFEGHTETDFYGNVLSPLEAINRKVIQPSEEEIARNNRARSAKLRIAQKR